mmetsp:Transcript_56746/g.105044  ORF Transcript_56746/g.105044 Transcript_56746/m.105044 type:complete len:346 (+) Transcript_56746:26-1063(+)
MGLATAIVHRLRLRRLGFIFWGCTGILAAVLLANLHFDDDQEDDDELASWPKRVLRCLRFTRVLWRAGASGQVEDAEADEDLPAKNRPAPRPVHMPLRPHVDARIDPAATIRYHPHPELESGAIVIVLPGGNYDYCDIDSGEGQVIAQYLTSLGIIAVLLHYRLVSQGHYWPSQLEDLEECLKQVKEGCAEWGGDASRIGVLGFSAGGHLASYGAVTAAEEMRPLIQILLYPCIDPATPKTGGYDAGFHWTASRGYPTLEESALHALKERDARAVPSAFIVGLDDDPFCPREENADLYHEKLQEKGVSSTYVILQESHGCGLQPGWQEPFQQWLQRYGFVSKLYK